jgi:secreted PhoX family phosphatase
MKRRITIVATVFAVAGLVAAAAVASSDFGVDRDNILRKRSVGLFGIKQPVATSSTKSIDAATANADPRKLVTLAAPLTARVVTAGQAAPNIDMMALWPNDTNPTTIIACNEQGTGDPGLQAIDIQSGAVRTLLTGTSSCDPAHVTPWGTIVFGEEAGTSGAIYELIDPDRVQNVTLDRGTGTFSDLDTAESYGSENFVARYALGRASFEGIGILPNGVTYYGDENRPASGTAGGAYFKFVPDHPSDGTAITDLSQSPLVSGSVYGLRLGNRGSAAGTDYGQGTNTGLGTWVPLGNTPGLNLRSLAATNLLTGYYRPEDMAFDREALDGGQVKVCGNNTGNEAGGNNVTAGGHTWGEAICLTDGTVDQAVSNTAVPEVQYFVIGSSDFAMMDNVAYQPGFANWILHEDGDVGATHKNNDLWDCLSDGADADTLSDGCLRIGTLNDWNSFGEGAEWTGGVFDSTGTRLFVSVQHNVTGKGVVLEITGWLFPTV